MTTLLLGKLTFKRDHRIVLVLADDGAGGDCDDSTTGVARTGRSAVLPITQVAKALLNAVPPLAHEGTSKLVDIFDRALAAAQRCCDPHPLREP